MKTIILTIFTFFDIIYYIIIFHIILSWLSIFGIAIRIKFIDDIILPIYSKIRKIFPTNIGPFDFTPIILMFIIIFLRGLLIYIFNGYFDSAGNIL